MRKDGKPVGLDGWQIGNYVIKAGIDQYENDCDKAYLTDTRGGKRYCNTEISTKVRINLKRGLDWTRPLKLLVFNFKKSIRNGCGT